MYFTAVDCPFSNGLNERLNQTLVNRLRCKINENNTNKKKPWTILMNDCVNEYNNTIHTVTKFTPNHLMNGFKINIIKDTETIDNNLEETRKIAFKNSKNKKNHERNEKYYNKNKINISFKSGDFVYVDSGNSTNRNKLDGIRLGPFKIITRLSNVLYEIETPYRRLESNVYHISKLYPAHV